MTIRKRSRSLGVMWVVALLALSGRHALGQCRYEITVVSGPECPPLGNLSVQFNGLNEHGQACGWQSKCSIPNASDKLPIVWTSEQGIILLPLPEGATRGEANDINNVLGSDGFGQVACTIAFPAEGGDKPYLYDDGVWTPLGLLPGAAIGEALAINDHTEIVGTTSNPAGEPQQAFVWRLGEIAALALPIGPNSLGFDINERASMVGSMGDGGAGFAMGFLFSVDDVAEIPPVANGNNSEATAVNSEDVVTGSSRIQVKSGPVGRRSWVFEKGRLIDLGGFADTHRNRAEDINDAGQIVGTCFTISNASQPFIWQHGVLTNLNTLFEFPEGFAGLVSVQATNNQGQIAGSCAILGSGSSRGFVLTPIDRHLADINLDCEVNGEDLAMVLNDWGPDKLGHIADIVTSSTFQPPGDGVVDGADLAVVLGNWTERPSAQQPRR